VSGHYRLLIFLTGSALFAQPYISYRGIVNAASSMPAGLPGGSIAQGSIFSLYGTGLGPATGVQVSAFPLQSTLAGVSMQIQQGATSVSAIPIFVSAAQINAIMPSGAPLGKVQIRVSYQGATSNPGYVNVVGASFGIFTISGLGFGPGVVRNFVSSGQPPLNSLLQSAGPGQTVTLYGTGLGPVNSDTTAPPAGNLSTKVDVFVGGLAAPVSYSGRSPCCSGLDQIDFQIPANAPQGCYVPVQVQTNGTSVSNAATISIQSGGGQCADALNPLVPDLIKGAKLGLVALTRTLNEWLGPPGGSDLASDLAVGLFFETAASPWPFNPLYSSPAPGTCMVYTGKGDFIRADALPGSTPAAELNAGPSFSVTGTSGKVVVPSLDSAGMFGASLGATGFDGMVGDYPTGTIPATLDPGAVSVSGPGGTAVGPLQGAATASAPLTWINRDQISLVDRSQPLSLTWSGGNSATDVVFITGANADLPSNASAGFLCSVPLGQQSFTVPAYVLANLPASHSSFVPAFLAITALPANGSAALSGSGLDAGYVMYGSSTKKTIGLQ
jgi:uncharacterized protein (TIGR03437 family)